MSHAPFSPTWLSQFTDPYAVLGVSVAADDRRILKRYHHVAKRLHPDVQGDHTPEHQAFINQILSKLVNPAYQRLKQEKHRSETLATLRFKVRRLSREGQFHPQGEQGRRLMALPEAEVDMVYEHALDQLSEHQYASVDNFVAYTQQIGELNLVYFHRKIGEPIVREKRTGLVGATAQPRGAAPPPAATTSAATTPPPTTYADRHFQRAHAYLQAKNVPAAIQELKDAIKIDPKSSSYHCLIGQAYLLHNLRGMAKVHFKQALRLNPNNTVAQKYAQQLKIDLSPPSGGEQKSSNPTPSGPKEPHSSGLFGRLFSNR